jgi:deoxyribodipyrimidine photo-lyase
VSDFEGQYGEKNSSYRLKFELLWREYFRWLWLRHGKRYFRFSGLMAKRPLKTFYPEHYKAWVEGNAGHKCADAAMRQPKKTDCLSSRARQWVASCFILSWVWTGVLERLILSAN